MQQLAIIVAKHVSLLGDNLGTPITLLLGTSDIHHRQFDTIVERAILLPVLQHKDAHRHVVLAGDHIKRSNHIKQVHTMLILARIILIPSTYSKIVVHAYIRSDLVTPTWCFRCNYI